MDTCASPTANGPVLAAAGSLRSKAQQPAGTVAPALPGFRPLEPWRKMRQHALDCISSLSQLFTGPMAKDQPAAAGRGVVLLKQLQDLFLNMDTLLDTQLVATRQEQEAARNKEREYLQELQRVLKADKLAYASLAGSPDFRSAEVQDLPHAVRGLMEENKALKSKVRSYKLRTARAEGASTEAETALMQLEMRNARLDSQLRECSLSPVQVQELQASASQCSFKDEVIKSLQEQLRVAHEKAESDRRRYVHQVKGLQRELAIIQDNHEVMVTAYTQPVVYPPHGLLSPTSPSQHAARAARRDARISALLPPGLDKADPPSEASLLSNGTTSSSSALQPGSPTRKSRGSQSPNRRQGLQPDVLRAVSGPAAQAGQALPALVADPSGSSMASNRNPRVGHRHATAVHGAGRVDHLPQQGLHVVSVGETAPFTGRPNHVGAYAARGGADPVLVRAVNSGALITHMRLLPSPKQQQQAGGSGRQQHPPPWHSSVHVGSGGGGGGGVNTSPGRMVGAAPGAAVVPPPAVVVQASPYLQSRPSAASPAPHAASAAAAGQRVDGAHTSSKHAQAAPSKEQSALTEGSGSAEVVAAEAGHEPAPLEPAADAPPPALSAPASAVADVSHPEQVTSTGAQAEQPPSPRDAASEGQVPAPDVPSSSEGQEPSAAADATHTEAGALEEATPSPAAASAGVAEAGGVDGIGGQPTPASDGAAAVPEDTAAVGSEEAGQDALEAGV